MLVGQRKEHGAFYHKPRGKGRFDKSAPLKTKGNWKSSTQRTVLSPQQMKMTCVGQRPGAEQKYIYKSG
jgi:hypothetical protein